MSYLRKCSLIVFGTPPLPTGTGLAVPSAPASPAPLAITIPRSQPPGSSDQSGLDLSAMRIQFRTSAMDIDAPPTARIRVFNLSDATARQVQREFQGVVLQAGYEDGAFGVIFQGTIVRVRKGKLDAITTFLDIEASNLDAVYNFGVVNKTLAAGASLKDRLGAIQSSVNSSQVAQGQAGALQQGIQYGSIPDNFGTGGTLPRGKVLFGMARDHLSDAADTGGSTWQVGPDGKINVIPLTGYLPGEAVKINAQTGMIRQPVATQQGVEVDCLLNPSIKSGTRIQLNNSDITTVATQQAAGFPGYGDFQFFASTSNDGVYRSIVVEHEGDSWGRGEDWLTHVVSLNVDSSSATSSSVAAFG